MSIFQNLNETEAKEQQPIPAPNRKGRVLLITSIAAATLLATPLVAKAEFNFGRLLDGAQSAWSLFRNVRGGGGGGGGQPTQAQEDQVARERSRMEAAQRAVGESRQFYQNVNSRSLGGIFNQSLRLLGEFGLLDPARARQTGPADFANAPGGGGSPAGLTIQGKPTTVDELIQTVQFSQIRPSLAVQGFLQSVNGEDGQKLLAQQREAMNRLTTGSQEIATASGEDAKMSAEIANENANLVGRIEALGNQAPSRVASQDLLRDLSQSQSYQGQIAAGNSLILERLTNISSNNSNQLAALQAQGELQSLQNTQHMLLTAAGVTQGVAIESELRDSRQAQNNRDTALFRNASMGNGNIFIYGFNTSPGSEGLSVPGSTPVLSSRP